MFDLQHASGYGGGDGSQSWTEKIVNNAIERTYDTLFNKNFVPWKFHPVGSPRIAVEGFD